MASFKVIGEDNGYGRGRLPTPLVRQFRDIFGVWILFFPFLARFLRAFSAANAQREYLQFCWLLSLSVDHLLVPYIRKFIPHLLSFILQRLQNRASSKFLFSEQHFRNKRFVQLLGEAFPRKKQAKSKKSTQTGNATGVFPVSHLRKFSCGCQQEPSRTEHIYKEEKAGEMRRRRDIDCFKNIRVVNHADVKYIAHNKNLLYAYKIFT